MTDTHAREWLLQRGARSLSDAELLSVVLGNGCRGRPVLDVSRDLLSETGGLLGLIEAGDELPRISGIGRGKSTILLALREMACRVSRGKIVERELLDRPQAVVAYLALRFSIADQEVLGAIYLDLRNRIVAEREFFRGTLSRASVEPRQIMKEALQRHASSFLLFHTHPSGDPTPSVEDVEFTRRMAKAGDLLGIQLLDHLVIGASGRWVSLRRQRAW